MLFFNIKDFIASTPAAPHWSAVGIHHHHGIGVPLFSLHSDGRAIGNYRDLIPLIIWCKEVGFDVIQLLPLNDTGHETSPYSAISAFALNPLHLDLQVLPYLHDDTTLLLALKEEPRLPADTLRVDYEGVRRFHESFLSRYIERWGERLAEDPQWQEFMTKMPWLESYALYKALKAAHSWRSWECWDNGAMAPSPEGYRLLLQRHQATVFYHSMIQFLCWRQWEEVRNCATTHGVLLKGDLPILINRDSADVWHHRHLFDLTLSAGAPPDMYSAEGQNWGIPLYRWYEEGTRLFTWWRERLQSAEKLYHLYRLDHLVGFFRIWAIPPGLSGRDGSFVPSDWTLWIPDGEKRLRHLLASTLLFPIGEDLGVVPQQVRACLGRLAICGTKVMRWERDWGEHEGPYLDTATYSPLSLTTVSTHDTETLRQWWRHNQDDAKLLASTYEWEYQEELTPDLLRAILHLSHHSSSLWHINLLSEYLGLSPELSWPDPDDERINTPGTCLPTNWSFRLRPSVEALVSDKALAETIRELKERTKIKSEK